MRLSKRHSGFTLIELLAAIIIVALLSAILFPVLAQVRAKAKRASCLSGIKELGMAHLMYWQDYDETTVTSWSDGFPGDFSWYVQPYLRSYNLLLCPSYAASAEEYGSTCNSNYTPGHVDNPTGEVEMWGYGYNTGHQWANDTGLTRNANFGLSGSYEITVSGVRLTALLRPIPMLGVKVSEIAAPSRLLLLGDTCDTMVPGLGRSDLTLPSSFDDPCTRLRKQNWPRHNGGNNIVYCDGHAAWYPYNDTILKDGYPAVVPDVCAYFRAYDGTNDPLRCHEGFAP